MTLDEILASTKLAETICEIVENGQKVTDKIIKHAMERAHSKGEISYGITRTHSSSAAHDDPQSIGMSHHREHKRKQKTAED